MERDPNGSLRAECRFPDRYNGDKVFEGHIVDIRGKSTTPGRIIVRDGTIAAIEPLEKEPDNAPFLLPGLTDAHIHIESTMLTPVNYSLTAVAHGVVNSVSDPHEIANVLGVPGIDYMIENARATRFNCFFGMPSCVPSSYLETAGASIDAARTAELLRRPDIWYLAEMMNYPGVVGADPEVTGKIQAALEAGKPVDGHARGIEGDELRRYAAAGITTDHECATLDDALERIAAGMKIIVRDGSAARNFDALADIIDMYPAQSMLCSDDKHPKDLLEGQIDQLVRRGIARGISVWNLLLAACINPVEHYGLPSGLMRPGDKATFIAVDNLHDFNVLHTVIEGHVVYSCAHGVDRGELLLHEPSGARPNIFNAQPITPADISLNPATESVKVIGVHDGELFTPCLVLPVASLKQERVAKIVVYNRYGRSTPKTAYIKGFDLSRGAIAASVAHDSHNIIAIGENDADICSAINALIASKGGMAVADAAELLVLPLPIAGLMTDEPAERVAAASHSLEAKVASLGCTLHSPFITMAFMALPVVPALKITDRGLVDVTKFDFTTIEA